LCKADSYDDAPATATNNAENDPKLTLDHGPALAGGNPAAAKFTGLPPHVYQCKQRLLPTVNIDSPDHHFPVADLCW